MSKENLKNEIISLCEAHWEKSATPLLLSGIPSMLLPELDVKEVLGAIKLKDFLSETSGEGGYKLVVDSKHKARIGIVPYSENYSYSSDLVQDSVSSVSNLNAFKQIFSGLTQEEQSRISFPLDVLLKILK